MDYGHLSNITKLRDQKEKTHDKRRMQWNASAEQSSYIGFVA
jgi:hypothetical protein